MAWWISLMLLSMAALLWKKSLDSTDDVIALLERIVHHLGAGGGAG